MKISQLVLLLIEVSVCVCLKTLVLYDTQLTENISDFEPFFQSLSPSLEFDIISTNEQEQFQLVKNEVLVYSNVILFTTKSKSIEISPVNLLKYVEKGGNVVVLSDTKFVNPSIRSFLNELGVYPSPKNHHLIDHFQSIDESHRLISLTNEDLVSDVIVADVADVKYKGSVALLSNNPLLFPVFTAPSTSYSKNVVDDDLTEINWTVGSQGHLVVGHQSLNNGRVLWIGDSEFFLENPKVSKQLIDWTFGLKNVLKINYVEHSHSNGETYHERPYKITDEISYNISISLIEDNEIKGFITDDLQLDVKLLDPYHRLNLQILEHHENETIYGIVFKLPDHHGVFSFEVNYQKPGYSYLHTKDIKSIRHLANDEYLRSWEITNSWVYITSSIVVFIAWFLFLWSFVYSSGKTSIVESSKKDE